MTPLMLATFSVFGTFAQVAPPVEDSGFRTFLGDSFASFEAQHTLVLVDDQTLPENPNVRVRSYELPSTDGFVLVGHIFTASGFCPNDAACASNEWEALQAEYKDAYHATEVFRNEWSAGEEIGEYVRYRTPDGHTHELVLLNGEDESVVLVVSFDPEVGREARRANDLLNSVRYGDTPLAAYRN